MRNNLKTFARHKTTGKITSIGDGNSPNQSLYLNKNWYESIQISQQLANLRGFFFKVKVPKFIFIDGDVHYLTTKWQSNDKIRVGYLDNRGDFDISFENSSEKEAKKSLKNYLEENHII